MDDDEWMMMMMVGWMELMMIYSYLALHQNNALSAEL
jgi:hypothetical protein